MGLHRNVFGEEMCAIPHSGEAGRENPVPASPQNVGHTTPAPAPVPRAMHQDEGAGLYPWPSRFRYCPLRSVHPPWRDLMPLENLAFSSCNPSFVD